MAKAKAYSLEAKTAFEEINSPIGIATNLDILGQVYQQEGQYEMAYETFSDALTLYVGQEYQAGIAEISSRLANYFKEVKQMDSAFYYQEILGRETREKLEQQRVVQALKAQRKEDSLQFASVIGEMTVSDKQTGNRSAWILLIGLFSLFGLGILAFVISRIRKGKPRFEQVPEQQEQPFAPSQVSNREVGNRSGLNRQKIEQKISFKLNDTDWAILEALHVNPALTYKELAEQVSLSFEGVRSSLKKMYRQFLEGESGSGQKQKLLVKVIELSAE